MYAAGNASACVAQGTCTPLGGHSVWAALPPLPRGGRDDGLPITLVLAGVDSTAFFHDAAKVFRHTLSLPSCKHIWQCHIVMMLPGRRGKMQVELHIVGVVVVSALMSAQARMIQLSV